MHSTKIISYICITKILVKNNTKQLIVPHIVMKKALTVSIGRRSFVVEEDAFELLNSYLNRFEASIADKEDIKEVMEDVEARIAEIFSDHIHSINQVVGLDLVNKAVAILGMPEVERNEQAGSKQRSSPPPPYAGMPRKRYYRDPDHALIGGVCAGIAAYTGIDLLLVRIVFACTIPLGGLGFWVYIVLWVATPKAKTIAEKLEMRGEPITAENISKYSSKT